MLREPWCALAFILAVRGIDGMAVSVERHADVCLAVLYQRPLGDSAVDRDKEELHTANTLTQTTQWTTLTLGGFFAGTSSQAVRV